jgi:3-hydroxyisobutyrate dehydrogenase
MARHAVKVMSESPIGSPMLQARLPLVLDLPDGAWFDVGLMDKDVRLKESLAKELGVPAPTARVADEWLTRARELGYEHRDIASLYRVLKDQPPSG